MKPKFILPSREGSAWEFISASFPYVCVGTIGLLLLFALAGSWSAMPRLWWSELISLPNRIERAVAVLLSLLLLWAFVYSLGVFAIEQLWRTCLKGRWLIAAGNFCKAEPIGTLRHVIWAVLDSHLQRRRRRREERYVSATLAGPQN